MLLVSGAAYAKFTITSLVPSEGLRGEYVTVEVTGIDFDIKTMFDFGQGIVVLDVFVAMNDSTRAVVELYIEDTAILGPRDVTGVPGVGGEVPYVARSAFTVVDRAAAVGKPTATLLEKTGVHISNGDVYVWGWRGYGLQGNGTKDVGSINMPARVFSLSNITEISGGVKHLLALNNNGEVYGWGYNANGQTGCTSTPGASHAVTTPCKVSIFGAVTQIAAGEHFSMALTTSGQVYAWGDNSSGQLGRTNTSSTYGGIPMPVYLFGETARLIGASYKGGFAVTNQGHVWAWGRNTDKGLGLPNTSVYSTPTRVTYVEPYAQDIVYISGGERWGEALLSNGRVIGWGNRTYLGVGYTGTTDMPVVITTDVMRLFARYEGSVALKNDGYAYTWGSGSYSNSLYGRAPVLRNAMHTPIAIGGGKQHIFYESSDDRLYGTGYNGEYKLNQNVLGGEVQWPGFLIWMP